MQQVAAEFQKEMMRNDINMELMDIGPEPSLSWLMKKWIKSSWKLPG